MLMGARHTGRHPENGSKMTDIAKGTRCAVCGVLGTKHAANRREHDQAVERFDAYKRGTIIEGGSIVRGYDIGTLDGTGRGWRGSIKLEELKSLLDKSDDDIVFEVGLRYCDGSHTDIALAFATEVCFSARAAVLVCEDVMGGKSLHEAETKRLFEKCKRRTQYLAAYFNNEGIPSTYNIGSDRYAGIAKSVEADGARFTFHFDRANDDPEEYQLDKFVGRYFRKGDKHKSGSVTVGYANDYRDPSF